MIIKEKIKETKTFKDLDKIQQVMLLKKVNVEAIRLGYKMSTLTSMENWKKVCSPNFTIKSIVTEILQNNKAPN